MTEVHLIPHMLSEVSHLVLILDSTFGVKNYIYFKTRTEQTHLYIICRSESTKKIIDPYSLQEERNHTLSLPDTFLN